MQIIPISLRNFADFKYSSMGSFSYGYIDANDFERRLHRNKIKDLRESGWEIKVYSLRFKKLQRHFVFYSMKLVKLESFAQIIERKYSAIYYFRKTVRLISVTQFFFFKLEKDCYVIMFSLYLLL